MSCKSGIYQIFNTINHKRYIGSSSNLKRRLGQHKYALKAGTHYNIHLQRAYNKYGKEAFKMSVLEHCEIENLVERERHWIEVVGLEYNVLKEPNSVLGYRHTEITKLKMSDIKRKAWASKNQNVKEEIVNFLRTIHPSNQGLERTESHRKKISDNMKRPEYRNKLWEIKQQKIAEGTFSYKKVPVVQYDINGSLIKEWDSIKETTNSLNKTNNSNIVNACKGRKKTAYGFIWKYKNQEKCL